MILTELRKSKPPVVDTEATAHRKGAVPKAQREPVRDEATMEDKAALEAMGFSTEGTKPKPTKLR